MQFPTQKYTAPPTNEDAALVLQFADGAAVCASNLNEEQKKMAHSLLRSIVCERSGFKYVHADVPIDKTYTHVIYSAGQDMVRAMLMHIRGVLTPDTVQLFVDRHPETHKKELGLSFRCKTISNGHYAYFRMYFVDPLATWITDRHFMPHCVQRLSSVVLPPRLVFWSTINLCRNMNYKQLRHMISNNAFLNVLEDCFTIRGAALAGTEARRIATIVLIYFHPDRAFDNGTKVGINAALVKAVEKEWCRWVVWTGDDKLDMAEYLDAFGIWKIADLPRSLEKAQRNVLRQWNLYHDETRTALQRLQAIDNCTENLLVLCSLTSLSYAERFAEDNKIEDALDRMKMLLMVENQT